MFLFRGYCQIILLVSTLSANQCLMESRVIKYDSLFNKFYRVCSNRFNNHQNLIELLNFGTAPCIIQHWNQNNAEKTLF